VFVAVVVAGLAFGVVGAPVASANPSHPGIVIAAAGSDTIEKLDDVILSGANEFNIHVPATLHTDPSPTITVPADAHCSAVTYAETAGGGNFAAPNGSGAGRDALKNSILGTFPDAAHNSPGAGGCIDIARSSAEPRAVGTDNSTFEYYALALDQITWSSPSLQAPAAMTLQNLRDIYACNITDWSQLPGGGSGPIQRFFPQSSSGTGATFISKVLNNVDPHGVSSASCPAVIDVQENRGNDPLITGALYQNAIFPYSNGKFVFQANNATNPTLDLRAGDRVGGLIMTPGVPTSALYGTRWTGSAFFLNNGTAVVNSRQVNTLSTTSGSTTITAAGANFTQSDVGLVVTGTNLPVPAFAAGGTPPTTVERIVSVSNATTAVVSLAATATGTNGALTIGVGRQVSDASVTALSTTVTSATANFTPADVGLTVQFPALTGGPAVGARIVSVTNATTAVLSAASQSATATGVTMRIGPAPASEANPNLGDPNDASVLPGVRYLYNVIDNTSVDYATAKTLVGFDTASSAKSDVCNAVKVSSIRSEGFLDLVPKTIGSNTNVTCRVKSPT
jgi:PBP superfamily domain